MLNYIWNVDLKLDHLPVRLLSLAHIIGFSFFPGDALHGCHCTHLVCLHWLKLTHSAWIWIKDHFTLFNNENSSSPSCKTLLNPITKRKLKLYLYLNWWLCWLWLSKFRTCPYLHTKTEPGTRNDVARPLDGSRTTSVSAKKKIKVVNVLCFTFSFAIFATVLLKSADLKRKTMIVTAFGNESFSSWAF